MNRSTPKRDNEPKQETLEEVRARYANTAKRVGINIKEVKPNHCLCKLVQHIKPITNKEGMALILPGDIGSGDELVLEVILAGIYNNENVVEVEQGDLLVVRDAQPLRFKYSTKLEVNNVEDALFHMVSNDDILYKVEYVKID
jgi:hypothetical protein